MDWKKINLDEVGYFCRSTRAEVDFVCYPLCCQIELLLGILSYYDIHRFQIKDIQNIYSMLNLNKMKSEGILKPRPGKLQEILGRLAVKNRVILELPDYIITEDKENQANCGYYEEIVQKGYQKDYIKDWVAYNEKNSLLKMENIPI